MFTSEERQAAQRMINYHLFQAQHALSKNDAESARASKAKANALKTMLKMG